MAFCSTSRIVTPSSRSSPDRREDRRDHQRGEARATARRAGAGAGGPSAPGRWPASAALRRTACPPSGRAARPAGESAAAPASRSAAISPSRRMYAPSTRFSRTVSGGASRAPRARARCPGARAPRSTPRRSRRPWWCTLPRPGRWTPAMVRSRLDLPGAVGPDEGDDLPRANDQAHPLQRADVAVGRGAGRGRRAWARRRSRRPTPAPLPDRRRAPRGRGAPSRDSPSAIFLP